MSNYRVDEAFDLFMEDIGEPHSCKPANDKIINLYKDKLPDQLFTYWRRLGWCGYANGLLWMTNPAVYQPILDNWLRATSFSNRKNLSVIARSAFGELEIWAKGKGSVISINPILGTITFFFSCP